MSKRAPTSTQQHRRDTRRLIALPFFGGLLLMILLVIVAAQTPRPGVIADVMLTVLMLCPLALCLLPLYLVLLALVGITGRLHDGMARPLRRLNGTSAALRARAENGMDRAARASIAWNVRFAWLDRLVFSLFDEPKPNDSSPKSVDGSEK